MYCITASLPLYGLVWLGCKLPFYNGVTFTIQAKVRARLSRPLQRGKGKHLSRGDFRPGYGASRVVKGPWVRPVPHSYSTRPVRGIATRAPPFSLKSSTGLRERRPPVMSMPARSRPLAPPSRSFERRPPRMLQFYYYTGWFLLLDVLMLKCYLLFCSFESSILRKELEEGIWSA